ncbi:MAG: AAA family ATPase [Parachlamydiaceae bacterium]
MNATELSAVAEKMKKVQDAVGQVIVGQKDLVHSLILALLADGHVLLEGLPGLAKTLAVTTLSQAIDCECKRIQFTPDLLPGDLIGTTVYNPKEQAFSVHQGPIFTNILLADEINRAPPKVQSALLEVMQERQISISGETFKAKKPFLVLATQNPVELEGTYPLPEAQLDRFMLKVCISYPSEKEEKEILARMARIGERPKIQPVITGSELLEMRKCIDGVFVDPKVTDYIINLVFATREPERFKIKVDNLIAYGASPRASIYLTMASKAEALLDGRDYVTPRDVRKVVMNVLRHRVKPTYEAEAEEVTSDEIVRRIVETIPDV